MSKPKLSAKPILLRLPLSILHPIPIPPLTFCKLSFSWRPRFPHNLRPLDPSNKTAILSFYLSQYHDLNDYAELKLELEAVKKFKLRANGRANVQAAFDLHHLLFDLLFSYATFLDQAAGKSPTRMSKGEFEDFLIVYAVLSGKQVLFKHVKWDANEECWVQLSSASGMNVDRFASNITEGGSLPSPCTGFRSGVALSDVPSDQFVDVPRMQLSHHAEEHDDRVFLSIREMSKQNDCKPYVADLVQFDWEPASTTKAYLRKLSQVDCVKLLSFWEEKAPFLRDVEELALAKAAVKELEARENFMALKGAAYYICRVVEKLMLAYDEVLTEVGQWKGALLKPNMFLRFAAVYVALCGRDVAFRYVRWDNEKGWKEFEPDQHLEVECEIEERSCPKSDGEKEGNADTKNKASKHQAVEKQRSGNLMASRVKWNKERGCEQCEAVPDLLVESDMEGDMHPESDGGQKQDVDPQFTSKATRRNTTEQKRPGSLMGSQKKTAVRRMDRCVAEDHPPRKRFCSAEDVTTHEQNGVEEGGRREQISNTGKQRETVAVGGVHMLQVIKRLVQKIKEQKLRIQLVELRLVEMQRQRVDLKNGATEGRNNCTLLLKELRQSAIALQEAGMDGAAERVMQRFLDKVDSEPLDSTVSKLQSSCAPETVPEGQF